MEKTSSELFNEEVEHGKEMIKQMALLDDVEREILDFRKQIDALRMKIREKEDEAIRWRSLIRTTKQLMKEKNHLAWQARHSGL